MLQINKGIETVFKQHQHFSILFWAVHMILFFLLVMGVQM